MSDIRNNGLRILKYYAIFKGLDRPAIGPKLKGHNAQLSLFNIKGVIYNGRHYGLWLPFYWSKCCALGHVNRL